MKCFSEFKSLGQKFFLFYLLMQFFSTLLFSQSKFGVSITSGMGNIYSPTLHAIQQSRLKDTPFLTSASASKGWGVNLGLGLYYQYTINDKFAILADPTFNFLNSKIHMNSKFEDMNLKGTGTQSRYSSLADLNTLYIQLPILFKYTFFQKRKLYVIAGGAANIILSSKANTQEEKITSVYGFERITSTEVEHFNNISTKLDRINPFQFVAVVGLGRQFRKKLNHFSVDLRYNFPIMNSTFYSSSKDLMNTEQNKLFSETGKEFAESKSPEFKLNDFKMGTFNLTIRYTIKKFDNNNKKVNSTKELEEPVTTSPIDSVNSSTINKKTKKIKKNKNNKPSANDSLNLNSTTIQNNNILPSVEETKPKSKKKKSKESTSESSTSTEEKKSDIVPLEIAPSLEGQPKESKKERKERLKKEKATTKEQTNEVAP
ncbi:MAG: PorT family protein [Cytophagales bacterium]|nr:MAG: PorT family protein [Cytophagales bacterium]